EATTRSVLSSHSHHQLQEPRVSDRLRADAKMKATQGGHLSYFSFLRQHVIGPVVAAVSVWGFCLLLSLYLWRSIGDE
ncbi:unnamed protein product, partial [Amoebophrya sp. A120]